MAGLRYWQLTSMYSRPDSDTSFVALGGAWPKLWEGTLALGFRSRNVGNVTVSSEVTSFFDQEILLAFSRNVNDRFSAAATLNWLAKGLGKDVPGYEGANGSGLALGLAFKYQLQPWLNFGLVAQNLGGRITYRDGGVEELDANVTLGGAAKLGSNTTVDLDLNRSGSHPVMAHLGVEWQLLPSFALRGGVNQTPKNISDTDTNFAGGLGVNLSGFTIDYAMVSAASDLTHYFSVSYLGEEPKPKTKSKRDQLHFSDVPDDYWAGAAIESLVADGVLNTYPDGTFRPEQPISRAETVTLLVRAKEYPSPGSPKQVFADVTPSFWAAEAIQTAYENKLTIGYPDGTFRPRNNTTRAEGMTFLARFDSLSLEAAGKQPFADLSPNHWAIREVLTLKDQGILDFLKSQPFAPDRSLTRAELAEVLYRSGAR